MRGSTITHYPVSKSVHVFDRLSPISVGVGKGESLISLGDFTAAFRLDDQLEPTLDVANYNRILGLNSVQLLIKLGARLEKKCLTMGHRLIIDLKEPGRLFRKWRPICEGHNILVEFHFIIYRFCKLFTSRTPHKNRCENSWAVSTRPVYKVRHLSQRLSQHLTQCTDNRFNFHSSDPQFGARCGCGASPATFSFSFLISAPRLGRLIAKLSRQQTTTATGTKGNNRNRNRANKLTDASPATKSGPLPAPVPNAQCPMPSHKVPFQSILCSVKKYHNF